MLYEIRLSDMEFYARHGCYDLEQVVGNRFAVDLVLTTELGQAAQHDDVALTVNYLNVYECVARQMARPQRTIECVASNIITAVKEEFPSVVHVCCTVAKLAPPLGGKVGRVSVTLAE